MNIQVFFFVYFLWIVEVKSESTNKIGLEECKLDEVTENISQDDFKNKFESSSGLGLWNIIKNEYGHFMPFMSEENLTQMCYCVSKKIYSFQGEISSIGYRNHYRYSRKIPYLSWLAINVDGAIKCYIVKERYFFLIETEKYYKTPKTRDLFVLEINESDLKDKKKTSKKSFRTYIKYPTGHFKALIPSVDLAEIV